VNKLNLIREKVIERGGRERERERERERICGSVLGMERDRGGNGIG